MDITIPDGPNPTREQIDAYARWVATRPPVEAPLEHLHIDSVYVRALYIPKDATLVGKVHATEHICIVAKGRILVASEQGRKELKAGDMWVSGPGAKRVGYALEDTIFINVHSNRDNDTDLAVLESKLITPEAIEYKEDICLGQP